MWIAFLRNGLIGIFIVNYGAMRKKWICPPWTFLLMIFLPLELCLTYSCNQKPDKGTPAQADGNFRSPSNEKEVYIDLRKVLSGNPPKNATDVTIQYDPFFKTTKKYRGYDLNPLIDSVIK